MSVFSDKTPGRNHVPVFGILQLLKVSSAINTKYGILDTGTWRKENHFTLNLI